MTNEELLERILMLEYHQKLLLTLLSDSKSSFHKLVIKKSMKEKDVCVFFSLCEQLSKEMEEQKAEGFVYFHPLYQKFISRLHPNLQAEEVIRSCIAQQLYTPLMEELKKYL